MRAARSSGLPATRGQRSSRGAALEAVAYQTRDLADAMKKDWKGSRGNTVLRVDGGMVASDWTMQRLADILDAPVDRPRDPGDDGAGCCLARRSQAQGSGQELPTSRRAGRSSVASSRRWTRKRAPQSLERLARRRPAHAQHLTQRKPAPFHDAGFQSPALIDQL